MTTRHAERIALALLLSLAPAASAAQDVPFTVAERPWDSETLGNHRAVLTVAGAGTVAHVMLPWRRRDRHPETRAVMVVDGATGQSIRNVRRGAISQASGELDFEPVSGPGRYFVYYLPYKSGGRSNYPNISYLPVVETADSGWLARLAVTQAVPAQVERFEAIDSLNSFYPMEVVATPDEVTRLVAAYPAEQYLIFPEDRSRSIRLRDQLPYRWIESGPGDRVVANSRRGEFTAFQLGIYAIKPLQGVRLAFSDLKRSGGGVIPSARLTSFNDRGVNWDGAPFSIDLAVPAGTVQALWCGVDVPAGAKPGQYRGTATITSRGTAPRIVTLEITVSNDSVAEGGASEPEKLTRLKWLNSTIAQRNDVIAPYTPLEVEGESIRLLGRRVTLGPSGLPARIETFFTPEMTGLQATPTPVLARPMRLEVSGSGQGSPKSTGFRFTRREAGTVEWRATTRGAGWEIETRGSLEYDGYLRYQMRLRATRTLALDDVGLEIPYAPGAAGYVMGLGLKGQRRPASFDWSWDVAKKNQDAAWLGGVNAGLYFSLRGENYARPLNTNFYLQKPLNLPPSWGNGGRGRIGWSEENGAVMVRATSGPRTLQPGDSLRYDVVFLITPFHAIDPDAQWSHRYYHRYAPLDSIAATGANVVNVHHATPINPYLNYPFLAHREMKAYIDDAHQRGLSVKIYNTVRELSNRAYETFALRSLGHEIYSPGRGGGYSWLQEHLGDDYIAAWFVPELKDAAVINSGMSRWHNYYVEGISWLVRHVGIDGLYLDDVAFDRTTMKRVKRVLRQDGRPGLVDLHSANQYNERDGFINSAILYLEHFPYLDRLWFGEYFDYEKNSPDFFLTEVSGIPFGLMGEMLEGGGNPWRGLVYGMTNRLPWTEDADPRPIWKLWDEFGIGGSRMLGYWAPNPPVKTGRPDVLATSYVREGRTLVAVASWAPEPTPIRLEVDWAVLGIDPSRAGISAPAVSGMQEARTFAPGEPITIAPGKGVILVVSQY